MNKALISLAVAAAIALAPTASFANGHNAKVDAYIAAGLSPAEAYDKVAADEVAAAAAAKAAFTGVSAGYVYVAGVRTGKAPGFEGLTPAQIYDKVAADEAAAACAAATVHYTSICA